VAGQAIIEGTRKPRGVNELVTTVAPAFVLKAGGIVFCQLGEDRFWVKATQSAADILVANLPHNGGPALHGTTENVRRIASTEVNC
jgi:hypothetical protein